MMMPLDFQNAKEFQTDIVLSPVQYQGSLLLKQAQQWVEQQDDLWPESLTPQTLVERLNLVYAAHWLLSGHGSATWSATIGKKKKRLTRCSNCKGGEIIVHPDGKVGTCHVCNGTGQIEEEYTDWKQENGVVYHHLDKYKVMNVTHVYHPPFSLDGTPQHAHRLTDRLVEQYTILPPESTLTESGRRVLEEIMADCIKTQAEETANRLGEFNHLHIAYVTINHQEVETWFYPLYMGHYIYEDELLRVMIDGLTGKFWAEAPSSVSHARNERLLQWIAIAVFIIGLLLLMWMTYHLILFRDFHFVQALCVQPF